VAGAGKDEVAKVLAAKHNFCIVSFADPIKRILMELYGFTPEQLWGSKKEEPDFRYPREHGPFVDGRCACCGNKEGPQALDVQCFLTPRWAARALGTELGRMLYPKTWVDYAMRVAERLLIDSTGGRSHVYDKYRQVSYHPQLGLFDRGAAEGAHADRIDGVIIPDVRWPAGNEGQAIKAVGGQLWLVERPGTSQTGTAVAKHASETQPIPDDVFDVILKNDGMLADLEHKVEVGLGASDWVDFRNEGK
jgi:hypothetical protein